ncbi:hypothetical protein P691DRAFT_803381, partial [Macrolepiota fuliginosa MF-IS2]
MPTTTATVTHNGSTHVSLKAVVIPSGVPKHSILSPPLSPSQSMSAGTAATVRSLYNRATRAFLHRDIRLTYTLLEAAFVIVQPPPTSTPDIFTDDRRKWDILRITLESTVYASNPSQTEKAALPDPLHTSLSETPHALISKFYGRSLSLFTPADSVSPGPNAAHIPPQVLATLVLASLRVECPDLGRVIIEDWLARRDPMPIAADEGPDGYAKILDLYCLHVLPKLQQWDYASEFLEYESELSPKSRERLKSQLNALRAQSQTSFGSSRPLQDGFDSATPRPRSPAASSSSSSSLSTTSTHTVVPTNRSSGLAQTHSRSSSRSSKSDATARAAAQSRKSRLPSLQAQNENARSSNSRSRNSRTASSSSTSGIRPSTLPRASPVAQSTAVTRLSTYSLVKATIEPYLSTSRLTTMFVLFVVFPLVSFLIRKRRRAAGTANAGRAGARATTAITNAELVRRRLGGVEVGILGRAWGGVIRAVTDTVKMAGSGL